MRASLVAVSVAFVATVVGPSTVLAMDASDFLVTTLYDVKAGDLVGYRQQLAEAQKVLKSLQASRAKAAKTNQADCHDEDGTCVASWDAKIETVHRQIADVTQSMVGLRDGELKQLQADIDQCKRDLPEIRRMKPFRESELQQIQSAVVEGRETREAVVERLHLCKTMALRFFNRDGVGIFPGPIPTILPVGQSNSMYHK